MMIGRIGEERLELLAIFDASKLGGIKRAVWVKFRAQHVIDAHVRYDRSKEIRLLRERGTHQQAAIAAAFNRKLFAARIVRPNQQPGAREKIVEHMLLIGEVSGAMPVLSV